MRTRGWIWRLVAELPAVVAGIALMTVATALLPLPWAGTAALLGWFVAAGLALTRPGERLLARAVLAGRRPTTAERAVLAGPIAALTAEGMWPATVGILVTTRPGWADGFGRRTVLVSRELITRMRPQQLTEDEVTALLVSAVGYLRLPTARWDAPLLWLSLPCLPLRVLAAAVGQATRGMVLIRFAWRIRALPIAAGAWQSATVQGTPGIAVLTVVVGLLSYLVPIASHRAARARQLAGDDFAVQAGHLHDLKRFLARFPHDEFAIERTHRLAPPPARLSVLR